MWEAGVQYRLEFAISSDMAMFGEWCSSSVIGICNLAHHSCKNGTMNLSSYLTLDFSKVVKSRLAHRNIFRSSATRFGYIFNCCINAAIISQDSIFQTLLRNYIIQNWIRMTNAWKRCASIIRVSFAELIAQKVDLMRSCILWKLYRGNANYKPFTLHRDNENILSHASIIFSYTIHFPIATNIEHEQSYLRSHHSKWNNNCSSRHRIVFFFVFVCRVWPLFQYKATLAHSIDIDRHWTIPVLRRFIHMQTQVMRYEWYEKWEGGKNWIVFESILIKQSIVWAINASDR